MKQKHFMDIENLRDGNTEFRRSNSIGFEPGDIIQISEKIDGANFSILYDTDKSCVVAFSRKQELTYDKTLSGAWNYAMQLDPAGFKNHPSWVVFGEWSVKNKIKYDDRFKNKWIVYDIYDKEIEQWLPQTMVRVWCEKYGFEYIHELYYGPFISWDHCRKFLNSPEYGNKQEGIVVKNQTKLNNSDTHVPFYLKIVNEDFKESMQREKVVDPEVEAAKAEALSIVQSIVTRNRIEKELFKMRDEGILPDKITPSDMKVVAQNLPKRIYDDCVKEENELVIAAGEFFGKLCGSQTMKIAREIILGE